MSISFKPVTADHAPGSLRERWKAIYLELGEAMEPLVEYCEENWAHNEKLKRVEALLDFCETAIKAARSDIAADRRRPERTAALVNVIGKIMQAADELETENKIHPNSTITRLPGNSL